MDEDDRARVGGLVRDRRLDLDMTQKQLAEVADVDVKTVRSLEAGDRWPREMQRRKIERGLQWLADSLENALHGEDPEPLDSGDQWASEETEALVEAQQALRESNEQLQRLISPLMIMVERANIILQDANVSSEVKRQAVESVAPAVEVLVERLPSLVGTLSLDRQFAIVTAVSQHMRGEQPAPISSRDQISTVDQILKSSLDKLETLDGFTLPSSKHRESPPPMNESDATDASEE